MKLLDSTLLTNLSRQAAASPRLRKHHNLHDSPDELCQRLLIAMEPGTYVHPHRHLREPKPECLLGLRGRMALVIFDNEGEVQQLKIFGPGEDLVGIDILAGGWHTVVCLEAGSVLFETKPGPYNPDAVKEQAPWAPDEGTPEVAVCRNLDYLVMHYSQVAPTRLKSVHRQREVDNQMNICHEGHEEHEEIRTKQPLMASSCPGFPLCVLIC